MDEPAKAHFGFDYFFNEPAPMHELASLGTTIPKPAFPIYMQAMRGWFRTPPHVQLPASDFLISIQRAGKHQFEVYPTRLRERLPVIHVPLRPDDADAMLDLQHLINRCYQHGRYEAVIDYSREPDPPLGEDDAVWADQLLRAAGMRQGCDDGEPG